MRSNCLFLKGFSLSACMGALLRECVYNTGYCVLFFMLWWDYVCYVSGIRPFFRKVLLDIHSLLIH